MDLVKKLHDLKLEYRKAYPDANIKLSKTCGCDVDIPYALKIMLENMEKSGKRIHRTDYQYECNLDHSMSWKYMKIMFADGEFNWGTKKFVDISSIGNTKKWYKYNFFVKVDV